MEHNRFANWNAASAACAHWRSWAAAWYLDAVTALLEHDPARPPAFVFVMQEKEPPYVVTVCQLSYGALELGRQRNERALNIYRRCRQTGVWPGYSDDIEEIPLPAWVERTLDQF